MQLLKMCKISHLNGSIITSIISKQQTTAQRTKPPIRSSWQHLGNIMNFTQTKNPTGNISWLCLLTLCLQIIMNTDLKHVAVFSIWEFTSNIRAD